MTAFDETDIFSHTKMSGGCGTVSSYLVVYIRARLIHGDAQFFHYAAVPNK